jgi:hypothetical protein
VLQENCEDATSEHFSHMYCADTNHAHEEWEGTLSFATDAWTLPNHKAYMALMVHFENDGAPVAMLLDLVEVAKSHSGLNLAGAFATVLDKFGITEKVSY